MFVSTEVCHHALGNIGAVPPNWKCNRPGRNNTCAESDDQITETMNLKKMRMFPRISRWEKEKKLPPEGELETDSNNLSEHLRG